MKEIKGFTTINHNVRVKLRLSLHEYTLLHFLFEWRKVNKNNPSVEDYWVNLGVKSDDGTIISLLSGLVSKGFLDLNHITTSKWGDEFVASADLADDPKTSNKPKNSQSKRVSTKKQFIPPTQKEVSDYFFSNGYDPNKGIEFWKYYRDGEPAWHDGQGTPLHSWKQKARSVWFKPHNLLPTKTENDIKKLVM